MKKHTKARSAFGSCTQSYNRRRAMASDSYAGQCSLFCFGNFRPSYREYHLGDAYTYEVEIIDIWKMTVKNPGRMKGEMRIDLQDKEYMAIRIRRTYAGGMIFCMANTEDKSITKIRQFA